MIRVKVIVSIHSDITIFFTDYFRKLIIDLYNSAINKIVRLHSTMQLVRNK